MTSNYYVVYRVRDGLAIEVTYTYDNGKEAFVRHFNLTLPLEQGEQFIQLLSDFNFADLTPEEEKIGRDWRA